MSPQFVDYDADGHLDIVVGTFDGSPHLSRGSKEGFLAPSHILDAKGERILANQFWNYDEEEWQDTQRCDPEGDSVPAGHTTSALAHDWDGDGDLDLLLGDYDGGRLYLRRNEGKPGTPAYASTNEPLFAGREPLEVDEHLMTPRLVDWDGDGKLDLLVGSGGDGYGDGDGGGVFLFRNGGKNGKTALEAAEVLVARGPKDPSGPVRPDAGLYPDAADIDGDGDLDLVVGGYSLWQPPDRELTSEEEQQADALETELEELESERQGIYERMFAAENAQSEKDAKKQAREAFLATWSTRLSELNEAIQDAQLELDALRPKPKREAFVWLYENLAKSPKSTAQRDP